MNKATLFVEGVLLAHIIWMWIHIFVFHEPAWLISLVVYLVILVLLADETWDKKTTTKDREVQKERYRLKERSTQTDDFIGRTEIETDSDERRTISDIKSEEKEEVTEMASNVSELSDETMLLEILTLRDELSSIEEESISEIENDPDSPALPASKIPFPFKERIEAVTAVCERMKFLAQTDPNFFKSDVEPMKNDKMADADLQCNKEKKLPFLQRKLRKVKKRFKKN
ncbi:hypothetical protein AVEN_173251-1 [Araneus ventricosus]|uniref:Uncharacterized protein n=1 Tax=Araneus ventricosus TaxID=182803 RepID=A0A4Y2JFV0_ARAVE|nr:hypothetical protein AVEN_173251-1 [Araneus ventricosus]